MIPILLSLGLMALRSSTMKAEDRVRDTTFTTPSYNVTDNHNVGLVIIAYNEEKYLPRALQSIKNQTRMPDTVIVVDNESDDRTVEIAQDAGATVVTYPHHNISAMRNLGARSCTGDILIFMDADTILESIAVERMISEIDNGYQLVYTNLICTDHHLRSVARFATGIIYDGLRPGIPHGCIMAFRRSAFENINGFDETFIPGEPEDRDIGERIAINFGTGSSKYIRDVYAGASARREISEGYSAKFNGGYWNQIAIRRALPRRGNPSGRR